MAVMTVFRRRASWRLPGVAAGEIIYADVRLIDTDYAGLQQSDSRSLFCLLCVSPSILVGPHFALLPVSLPTPQSLHAFSIILIVQCSFSIFLILFTIIPMHTFSLYVISLLSLSFSHFFSVLRSNLNLLPVTCYMPAQLLPVSSPSTFYFAYFPFSLPYTPLYS